MADLCEAEESRRRVMPTIVGGKKKSWNLRGWSGSNLIKNYFRLGSYIERKSRHVFILFLFLFLNGSFVYLKLVWGVEWRTLLCLNFLFLLERFLME